MNIQELILGLREANDAFSRALDQQDQLKPALIAEEVPLTLAFVHHIRSLPDTEIVHIHDSEAVLLYEFETNGKTLISPKAYLKLNGEVVYEVYDEEGFRYHRPHANIRSGYNIISLAEFLSACSLPDILSFYEESMERLKEDTQKISDSLTERQKCIDSLKLFFQER